LSTPLSDAMNLVKNVIPAELGRLFLNGPELSFLDRVVQTYGELLDQESNEEAEGYLDAKLERLSALKAQVIVQQDVISNTAGVGHEWEEAGTLAKRISKLIEWLKDVSCVALEGSNILHSFRLHSLAYQKDLVIAKAM
jgi:hypothetical protein